MSSSPVPTWPEPNRAMRTDPARSVAHVPVARVGRRRHGCLGTLAAVVLGVVLGAVVAVAYLAFANPQPRAASPVSPGAGNVVVTVDDAFLTTALRVAFQRTHLPVQVRAASAHCVPGDRVLVGGDADLPLLGVSAPVTMTLQPVVGHGRLTMRILSAHIGGLTLPATADAALERALDAQLSGLGGASLGGAPGAPTYAITGVTTADGQLTLTLGST